MRIAGVLSALLTAGTIAGWATARGSRLEDYIDQFVLGQWDRADYSLLDDGRLHVILCGTSAALARRERGFPCTAVLVDGELILVDAGPGAIAAADLLGLPIAKLSRILVTHFHSDHIGGLGQALAHSWFRGREQIVHVYGPPGLSRIVEGFQQVYAADTLARSQPGGDELNPRWQVPVANEIEIARAKGEALVFESSSLRVWAFEVDHRPMPGTSLGFRLEWSGRSVVWSGDTRNDPRIAEHARGASLLIHSASGLPDFITESAERWQARGRMPRVDRDLFASPVEAAQVAQSAGAETLVFSHIPPISNAFFRWYWLRGVDRVYDGQVVVGEDGMHFTLSALPATGD